VSSARHAQAPTSAQATKLAYRGRRVTGRAGGASADIAR
jgi:hypothetical protein